MNGQRKIRSFVRRAGRMTSSQARAIESLWPQYGIDFSEAPLDFDEVFGRKAKRVLEIGFGNGDSLVEMAANEPDADFLGVEVHEPGIGHCLIRAREAGADNLRVICHDAIEVLSTQIPDGSLARVNLFFPDPWPKKRHHKRRIIQAAFLDLVARKLGPGGSLMIATDWANYAEHIDDVIGHHAAFDIVERRQHDGDQPINRPSTKFEARGLREGHHIWDWHCSRK